MEKKLHRDHDSPVRVSKWRSFELWLGPAHTHVVTERSVAAELKLEPDPCDHRPVMGQQSG